MQDYDEHDRRRTLRERLEHCSGTFTTHSLLSRLGIGAYRPFKVIDCSTSGMRLATFGRMDPNQRYAFVFPDAKDRPLRITGSTMWSEELRGREGWLGGVCFDSMSEGVLERLERHIKHCRPRGMTVKKPRWVRYYQKNLD